MHDRAEDRLATMANPSFWRRRAPIWLRVLLGLLILPVIWACFTLILEASLPPIKSSLATAALLVAGAIIAGFVSWIIVRKASARVSAIFTTLTLLAYGLVSLAAIPTYQGVNSKQPQAEAPVTSAPTLEPPPLALDEGPAGEQPAAKAPAQPPPPTKEPDTEMIVGGKEPALLPAFPWPPPAASASYVLPDKFFEHDRTVGEVTAAILAALEQNGYVERSFFRTEPGGVVMVTRLERINDDGSPSAARWPAIAQHVESTRSLLDFLQGLFFVDPGHYRVIVFVLQDLPFSQSPETITAQQAHAWIATGTNVLPREVANLSFDGARVTVLIYEFASDGSKVQLVPSQITGKQHLEKAGVLAVLDQTQ
ncbi:MAG TPA: hypothetical protein VLB11_04000 [Methyloceanibacter sp.]|nr:hypothetical protein [Methyloceanibacter sp.]